MVSCILLFLLFTNLGEPFLGGNSPAENHRVKPTIKAITNNNRSSGAYIKDIVTRTRYASPLFTEQCKTGLVLNLFIASFDKHEVWFQRICSLISGQLALISLTVTTNRLPKNWCWFLIRFAEASRVILDSSVVIGELVTDSSRSSSQIVTAI